MKQVLDRCGECQLVLDELHSAETVSMVKDVAKIVGDYVWEHFRDALVVGEMDLINVKSNGEGKYDVKRLKTRH